MLTVPDEVKELLKSDSVRKNFRISFPNGERADIINDNLIQESVSFTESVCSQNTLKYGLSEASTLSFQTVGVENIKGYVIDAEIEIDATEIADTVGNIQESDDVDYPYYPIPYGRFIVDSCKRSGEMEQRQVECYSYPTIGFNNLFLKTMEYIWPESTYTVSQPGLFMVTYLNHESLSDEYITSTTDIEYTSDSKIRSNSILVRTSPNSSYDMRFTVSGEYTQKYDVRSVADTTNHLLHYKISKTANFDNILENAISDVLADFDNIRTTYGLEGLSFIYQGNYARFRSEEDMIKSFILEYSYPIVQCALNEGFTYRTVGTIEPEEGICYCQSNTFTVNTNYSATANPLALIYAGCTTDITIAYRSFSDTVSLSGPLFEVSILEDVEVDSSIVSTYDGWNIYLTSEDYSSKSFTYYTASQEVTTSANFYSFNDADAWKTRIEELYEVNATFGCYERGSNAIKALNNTVAETIEPSRYITLWYDDEAVQAIDGVYYTYDNNGTAENTSYGMESFYDLTSNTIIQKLTSTSDVETYLEEYFFPNAIYSEYVPYNLTCVGLPYLEAGDYITVKDKEGNEFSSYIMRQTISGIQHLTSSLEAQSVDV